MRALAIMVLSLAAATSLAAVPFTPAPNDFAVVFPSAPEIQEQPPRTRDDPGHRNYLLRDGPRSFEVTVDEYPASIPTPAPDELSYMLLLNAHAREIGWRLAQTRKVTVSGRPALEGRIEGDGGQVELMRVVMVGRDIYQVRASDQSTSDLSAAVAFLDSFTVKPKPAIR